MTGQQQSVRIENAPLPNPKAMEKLKWRNYELLSDDLSGITVVRYNYNNNTCTAATGTYKSTIIPAAIIR